MESPLWYFAFSLVSCTLRGFRSDDGSFAPCSSGSTPCRFSDEIRMNVFSSSYPTIFMKIWIAAVLFTLLLLNSLSGARLKSGPMLGYSTMKEVLIWVQSDGPASVQIRYWEEGRPETARLTDPVETEKETSYIAHCIADQVSWSKRYSYLVLVDGEEAVPQFREGYERAGPIPLSFQTQPRWRHAKAANFSPPDFRVAAGSCAYLNEEGYNWEEGQPYGGDHQIFESIYEKEPDLMLWLGDNIYLREADWNSRTGIHHRYDHFRSLPELRPLFASVHHLAIWDDHDYGPNDAGYEFWNKEASLVAFKLYWGNPSYGFAEMSGTMTFFNWGDVNFYFLDNRYYRVTAASDPQRFGHLKSHHGKKQVDWLVDTMAYQQGEDDFAYPASFNIVLTGSQVLNDRSGRNGYRNYRKEWQYLIDRIMDAGIDGVIFLTGDVHYTELSREVRTGGGRSEVPGQAGEAGADYVFHDLTVSPLTSSVNTRKRPNSHRVEIFPDLDTHTIRQRNFAILDFKGPKEDRRMEIRIFDSDGNLLNRRPGGAADEIVEGWTLHANDLQAP